MKKLNAFLVSVFATVALNAAVIEQVIVRQQWPWSTDVKVEYKISAVTNPVDIAVKAYNGDVELPLPPAAITGDRYGLTEDGVGTLVIDPVKAFGTAKVALANFKVKLTLSDSAEDVGEVLYKIFDLTTGDCEDITRAALLNGRHGSIETDYAKIGADYVTTLSNVVIWTEVTNVPAYKTTHLVMRKIPAAGKVWQIGSPTDEPGRATQDSEKLQYVRLTQDFYIGVFEMTQSQWMRIYTAEGTGPVNPSTFTDETGTLPVNNVSYSMLRGNQTYTGVSGEKINWPTNSTLHEVVSASDRVCFLNDLRKRCKNVEFDLPFDPQWEFACRAGTSGGLNDGLGLRSGSTTSDRLETLGWYADNADEMTHAVGLKRPNAFGLYDMHGNIGELLANWGGGVANATSGDGSEAAPLEDPLGPVKTSGSRTVRGGDYACIPGYCRSASRAVPTDYYKQNPKQGFRVVCPVGKTW